MALFDVQTDQGRKRPMTSKWPDERRRADVAREDLLARYFDLLPAQGIIRSVEGFRYDLTYYYFPGIDFEGKTMLVIGAGTGIYSFCAACMGASRVVCLEPEAAGSRDGTLKRFVTFQNQLGLEQVFLKPLRFQDFQAEGETFDIILLRNSINHLDEEACIRLQYDQQARETYSRLFQKMSALAHPGTRLIIADCSRYNFFAALSLRNPLAPSIEWHKHQSPYYWSRLLPQHGFRPLQLRWRPVHRLGRVGRAFLANRFAAFFLRSHFCLILAKEL